MQGNRRIFSNLMLISSKKHHLLSPCTLLLPPVTALFLISYKRGDNKTTNPPKKIIKYSTFNSETFYI